MRWFLLPILFTLVACEEQAPRRSLATGKSTVPTNAKGNINPTNLNRNTPAKDNADVTDSGTTANALHPRCQSAIRCLYAQTPAYSQGDDGLENYIGTKIGNSEYEDPGLCAPTAMGILIKAVLSE